ncbi:MFS general substrate transporter [Hortaea werneckii]|nr:MFS general substrate transporter [Hortaea werneckii]
MSGWKYAFSLTKEQVAEAEPPGTVRLIEHDLTRTRSGRNQQEDHVQLLPPPTRNARDPLNWPLWRKYCVLLTMALYGFVANFAASIVAPAIPIMMFQMAPPHSPPVSTSKLTKLVAVNVLMMGVSNIFWVPLANTFGRRPVLITSMLLATVFSIWAGVADSFGSLLAARVMQGLGYAPADTIAPDVAAEVFFIHERGRAIAIYTLLLALGPTVGGICGGHIAGKLGYRYIFYISAALLGFVLLCQIFLVPETLFDRQRHLIEEQHPIVSGEGSFSDEKANVQMIERTMPGEKQTLSFGQSLKVGTYHGSFLKHLIDPWRSLAFPGVWVVLLQYGGLLGGLVTISTIGPQLLAQPPYLWGNDVGLIGLGAFVGTILGGASTYFLADFWMKRAAKKISNGLAEPETRLPVMFLALFLAFTGMWTFGFSAANPSPHAWVGMVVGYGMVGFGITQIPSIGFNYIIDSYNAISSDCFVMTTISRSVVSFAWTFFVADWVAADGAAMPFGIFGMIMAVFALLTIPLWLFGKRMRIATAGYLPKHSNH